MSTLHPQGQTRLSMLDLLSQQQDQIRQANKLKSRGALEDPAVGFHSARTNTGIRAHPSVPTGTIAVSPAAPCGMQGLPFAPTGGRVPGLAATRLTLGQSLISRPRHLHPPTGATGKQTSPSCWFRN